ncbi:MerR family DNA-binding protein [Micromonospora vinacea]|uniref:MerR family DNA-binding protein n=1 Tax=Micromonospora vinacea TaxID=709878 RepID=UPI00344DDA72
MEDLGAVLVEHVEVVADREEPLPDDKHESILPHQAGKCRPCPVGLTTAAVGPLTSPPHLSIAEPGLASGTRHRLYPAEAVTVLRVIKAAQALGFNLDEIADLLGEGRHRHGPDAGLRTRAHAKLAQVEARIADLQVVAGTLRTAVDAGCDDLVACAGEPCCPIPFAGRVAEEHGSAG